MANINRDYQITINVRTDELIADKLEFVNSDRNTANIYVKVIPDIVDLKLKMRIRANDEKFILDGQIVGQMIYEFELPTDLIQLPGTHKMELQAIYENKIRTYDYIPIKVNKSITTGLGGE